MPTFYTTPTFERQGVVAGFVLRGAFAIETRTIIEQGVGPDGEPVSTEYEIEVAVPSLTPVISKGVLWANGTMYRPGSAPAVGAAPASTRSHLFYHTGSGFYWQTSAAPANAADAYLGWVLTDGSAVVQWSSRRIGSGPDATEPLPVGPGTVRVEDAPASYPDAPEVTAATMTVNYAAPGGLPVWYGTGEITLPVANPEYGHLVRLHIEIAGLPELLAIAALDFDPDPVTHKITYRAINIVRDTAEHVYTPKVRGENEDGSWTTGLEMAPITVTAGPGIGAAAAPVPATDAEGREVSGALWVDPATRLVYTTIGATPTWDADDLPQTSTYYVSDDNGVTFVAIGWEAFLEEDQEVQFYRPKPVANGTWKVAFAPGTQAYDPTTRIAAADLPDDTVVSLGFTVAGLAVPGAHDVTSLTVASGAGGNTPYNQTTPDGWQYWSIPSVSYSDTGCLTDKEAFFVRVTMQEYSAAGASVGPEQPFAGTHVGPAGLTQTFGPLMGEYGLAGFGYTRSANVATVRFRVYVCNRVDQTSRSFENAACATLQTDVGSGLGYVAVTVASGGTPPAGALVPSRMASGTLATGVALPASQISGPILASQISSIAASQISGLIAASQITSVAASQLTGTIAASQIGSVAASQVTGTIAASQIGSVAASTISGTIAASQIAGVAASVITGMIAASQIAGVAASVIAGTIAASQIGSLAAGQITGTLAASQIGSVAASTITGSLAASQIAGVAASTISGSIAASQIGSVAASVINGVIVTSQLVSGIVASLSMFSAGLSMVQRVGALPSTTGMPAGALVLLTAANALTNPDAETGNTTGWTGSGHSASSAQAHAGTYSFAVAGGYAYIQQAPTASAGQSWTCSCWARTNGAAADATMYLRFYSGAGGGGSLLQQDYVTQASTSSWTPLTLTKTAPASTASVMIAIQVGAGGGTWYIDDCVLMPNAANQLYQLIAGAWTAVTASSTLTGTLAHSDITSITASQITGLILAAQISTIAASQVTGSIQASQISSIAASQVSGSIQASQIGSVAASQVTGAIQSSQIGSIAASTITGTVQASQIGTVNSSQINVSGNVSVGSTGFTAGIGVKYTGSAATSYLSPGQVACYDAAGVGTLFLNGLSPQISLGAGSGRVVLDAISGYGKIWLVNSGSSITADINGDTGDVRSYGSFDFSGSTAGTAGSLVGYVYVKVGGTQRKIPYYAV